MPTDLPPPNIVMIFTDDQGYGDLGCFGSQTIRTPNLDRLAQLGMKFTDFHAAASVCTPSRAALLTGCYPRRIDMEPILMPNSPKGLNPGETTIASLLRGCGYRTSCIGKWHLGDRPEFMPNAFGFDEFFGLPYSNDMIPPKFPDLPLYRNREIVEHNPDQDEMTRRYTAAAEEFIRSNDKRPFFLYLAYSMPHRPCHASSSFAERVKGKGTPGETKESRDFLYPAAVEEIDWSVGEVFKALEATGAAQNTLIVFTSDNGPAVGSAGPLRAGKGSPYEGGHRMPCVMVWPGHIPAGTVCEETATCMDMLPTFAAVSGGSLPKDRVVDGRNIQPLMEARQGARSPYEVLFHDHRAVRSGKWKLLLNPLELYDLSSDVGEKHNVASAHPDVVERLRGEMDRFEKELQTSRRPSGMVKE